LRVSRNGAYRRIRKRSRVALVCAGGGVTGAVYEIGCLRAVEELLDRSILDLDLYVGVSGGAFVASLLAGGVSPYQMYDEITANAPMGMRDAPLFRLGASEFLKRSAKAPRILRDAVATTLSGEGRNLSDLALALFQLLPAGILDNSGIREFLEQVARARRLGDRFDKLKRELYIVAVDLDDGEAVAFGEPPYRDVRVSLAVQASTALPGLYRPVRIRGRDFVDGGVKKTAHINLAIEHGADLVICVNPIVPIRNSRQGPLDARLSDKGITYVLDQALRIALYGRMQYGLERYRAEHPEVDILLIQPTREDMRMFSYNIMRYSARRVVADYGYRSALTSFRKRRREYERVLRAHGITLGDPAALPDSPPPSRYSSSLARSLGASLEALGSRLERLER
jgi:predicted acylesterase/phospholipase RssA